MRRVFLWLSILLILSLSRSHLAASEVQKKDLLPFNQALLRKVMDGGPYRKPWKMEGIGKAHFPVTSSHPEVQQWFDQGIALAHSFWWFEAKRSFRWCLRLDPDCAMAYWALAAIARVDQETRRELLREAAKRKNKVSERERLYIEAWVERSKPLPPDAGQDERRRERQRRRVEFRERLEEIILKYPEDVEAKSFYGREVEGRYGRELVFQQILDREPEHPGAHHYRIHTWDGPDGGRVLDSSNQLPGITTKSGHPRHMPGHVFSGIGMWHEGAIAMDAANRVELAYLRDHDMLPYESWNYVHNRTYLCYIQEQLGMADAAIAGARDLLAGPAIEETFLVRRSPRENGESALVRALVKFERWQDLLDLDWLPGAERRSLRLYRQHAKALAQIALGNLDEAEEAQRVHAAFKEELQDNEWALEEHAIQASEIGALLALGRGDTLGGLSALGEAAKRELERRESANDPPQDPRVLYNVLGRPYLENQSPVLAVKAFQTTLDTVPNQGTALAGLVEAYGALGDRAKAQDAYSRLMFLWSDADPNLAAMERAKTVAKELDLRDDPKDTSAQKQRRYGSVSNDELGSDRWVPNSAPKFEAKDAEGKGVDLASYKGENVVLVFHTGDGCPSCSDQIEKLAAQSQEFADLETQVIVVGPNFPKDPAKGPNEQESRLQFVVDENYQNARRFKAYDDFEDTPIPATVLIDKQGRVYWSRLSHQSFHNFDFLLGQIRFLNDVVQAGQGLLARK